MKDEMIADDYTNVLKIMVIYSNFVDTIDKVKHP